MALLSSARGQSAYLQETGDLGSITFTLEGRTLRAHIHAVDLVTYDADYALDVSDLSLEALVAALNSNPPLFNVGCRAGNCATEVWTSCHSPSRDYDGICGGVGQTNRVPGVPKIINCQRAGTDNCAAFVNALQRTLADSSDPAQGTPVVRSTAKQRQPDCAALASTYRSGPTKPLPPECMSEAEQASAYSPGAAPQVRNGHAPEPVIDGSKIPSTIDFSGGGPARLGRRQESAPPPSLSPAPPPSALNELLTETQPRLHSAEPRRPRNDQPEDNDTATAEQSIFDRVLERFHDARRATGDYIRRRLGTLPPEEDAPHPATQRASDEAEMSRAQNPANLGKGVNRYDSDLHDTVNEKIDRILDP